MSGVGTGSQPWSQRPSDTLLLQAMGSHSRQPAVENGDTCPWIAKAMCRFPTQEEGWGQHQVILSDLVSMVLGAVACVTRKPTDLRREKTRTSLGLASENDCTLVPTPTLPKDTAQGHPDSK